MCDYSLHHVASGTRSPVVKGAQRILLIIPKSLIGQWQNELLNLFGRALRKFAKAT
jgi:hypothetical protein